MTESRKTKFSKTDSSTSTSATAPNLTITLLGDSTIDNKIWVFPGIYGNGLLNKVGIHGSSPRTRVRRSHGLFAFMTELSVVENLMDMLPRCRIRDFTNDGFTTTDCLNGAYKDKVFGEGSFNEFPHVEFAPLDAAKTSIAESNYIVLSVGGNNFREFLQGSFRIANKERRLNYIRREFANLVENTQREYIELLQRVIAQNPAATIVLNTQYYPSFVQDNYRIYDFMQEVGQALHPDKNDTLSAEDVIHDLVKQLYSGVLTALQPYSDKIIVADLTSSLDPHDTANHVRQIEPSGIGGRKIASMLAHLMTQNVERGHVYQFSAAYFTNSNKQQAAQHVTKVALDAWKPKHPNDFKQSQQLDATPRAKV